MRSDFAKGKWLAAPAAFLLAISACAPPTQTGDNVASLQSPTPSPSPTPTSAFAASGPGFHAGEVGIGYSPVALTAGGGVAPYHWTVSAGVLPPGLSLNDDGSVSGEPTTPGKYGFTIQAADSGGSKAAVAGVITIAPPLNAALIPACAKYCVVELGCVNACGGFGQLSGGVAPFSYKLLQGSLPLGTKLAGLSLLGTFTGQSGYLQFSVQVTDALGATSTVSPTFWMYPLIALAGDSTTCFLIFTDCNLKLKITGGVPSGNPSVALVGELPQPGDPARGGCWNQQQATPLPTGYRLTVSGGSVNLFIPRPGSGYGGIWTLVLTDHTLCAASTNCKSGPATVHIGIECN